jgi:hypothetical protein
MKDYIYFFLLLIVFWTSPAFSQMNSESENAKKLTSLITRLIDSDRTAIAELADYGPDAFEPLAKAFDKADTSMQRWYIILALRSNPNPKTIAFFAKLRFGDFDLPYHGEVEGLIRSYLLDHTGYEFRSHTAFEEWYELHKNALVWSKEEGRFVIAN